MNTILFSIGWLKNHKFTLPSPLENKIKMMIIERVSNITGELYDDDDVDDDGGAHGNDE